MQIYTITKNSVSCLKIENTYHRYEWLIKHEKRHYAWLFGKVKNNENEKKEQRMLKKIKSMLDHQKVERESDISSLRKNLAVSRDVRKYENERRISKPRGSWQFTENLHQLQDESSLIEPPMEKGEFQPKL